MALHILAVRSLSYPFLLVAGAVNSPQILLLSGLGPSANLTALNITTIVDLPYVGSNLQDHALLLNTWEVNANFTWDDINRNTTLFEQEYALWNTSRNGTFTAGTTTQVAWLRLADNDTIFENFTDPAAGLTSGHYEFVFSVSGQSDCIFVLPITYGRRGCYSQCTMVLHLRLATS